MTEHTASRTLVKSPPELWAECSQPTALTRHLDSFGDIKITRLEPETAVAWEGDRIRGTVRLEPSGWGTRVTLTAVPAEVSDPETVAGDEDSAPPPALIIEPLPRRRSRILGRLIGRLGGRFAPAMPPGSADDHGPVDEAPPPEAAEEPVEPAVSSPADPAEEALAAALDSLGQAHHRPFSRG